ncbi:MAG: hypothetical protein AVO33_07250 [delta proteobacterium ML8_F1]|nr:MAG: hypothetical protein AVO33_07250 [delta proteobacterium ML8_F1]
MKVVAKPIEVVAWFNDKGGIRPLKFRVMDEEEPQVVKVDRMVHTHLEKFAGNPMHVFDCQSTVEGQTRIYQLKYEVATGRWILFKI